MLDISPLKKDKKAHFNLKIQSDMQRKKLSLIQKHMPKKKYSTF